MRVLMFGWELPPYNSGGLGVACYNLATALCEKNTEVIFVLPRKIDIGDQPFSVLFAESGMRVRGIHSPLMPYITAHDYLVVVGGKKIAGIYGNTLLEEVVRYGKKARELAAHEQFDVIHAHDWLSFPAGIEAKMVSGKPLVVHVHATEFDRTGGSGVNEAVYAIEKMGMAAADRIIAVSQFTKNIIIEKYGIPADKVEVVYNAVDRGHKDSIATAPNAIAQARHLVLFVGRITLQKGPDYFLEAAHKVLQHYSDVLFVMAGDGDMFHQMVSKAAALGIADRFIFTGFLRDKELQDLYRAADLYVMPSVSEPFGLTAIEALEHGTPILISKQTGVGESLSHCLKVDFWDVEEMASKIIAVLEHRELQGCLAEHGKLESLKFSWERSADQCENIYQQLVTHN